MLPSGICNDAVRIGGFGPKEGSHLTSCFNDVVITPIPTWVLIIISFPLLLSMRNRTNYLPPPRHHLIGRIVDWLYYVLVFAALLMSILEITRLALSHSGIGLLPFNLAGILLAAVYLHTRRSGRLTAKLVGGVLFFYWIAMTACQAIKVSTLVWVEKLEKSQGNKGPSKYPNSDKSLDNYVILGLYAVFTLYELFHLFRSGRTQSGLRSSNKLENQSETRQSLVV